MLLRFHKETGGGSWIHREGWAENADDLGSWFGVGVDGEGLVVQLELQGDIVAQYEARPHREGNNICGKSCDCVLLRSTAVLRLYQSMLLPDVRICHRFSFLLGDPVICTLCRISLCELWSASTVALTATF